MDAERLAPPRHVFATAGATRTDPRTLLADNLPLLAAIAGLFVTGFLADTGVVAVFIALRMAGSVIGWSMTRYTLTAYELRVDSGMLTKRRRELPVERIQQVDVVESTRERVLSLATVRIDVAGETGHTTVVIHSLDRGEAERLSRWLLERRAPVAIAAAPAAPPPPATSGSPPTLSAAGTSATSVVAPATGPPHGAPLVLTLQPAQLALVGVSGKGILTGLIPVAYAAQLVDAFGNDTQKAALAEQAATRAETVSSTFLATAGVVGVMVLVAVAAVIAIVQWFEYRLWLDGDHIVVHHGLLQARRLSVPRRRIQHVRITDNPLRRRLGFVTLRFDTAGGGSTHQEGPNLPNALVVPFVPRERVADVLAAIVGDTTWRLPELARRPPAARRRSMVRGVLVAAIAAAALAALDPTAGFLAIVPLVAAGAAWGAAAHRRAGWGETPAVLAFASGVLLHRIEVASRVKVQSARAHASPLQRRSKLETIRVDVAGRLGAPGLRDVAAGAVPLASLVTAPDSAESRPHGLLI